MSDGALTSRPMEYKIVGGHRRSCEDVLNDLRRNFSITIFGMSNNKDWLYILIGVEKLMGSKVDD
jgi:hypothetical protein